jgi:hypothetical protein
MRLLSVVYPTAVIHGPYLDKQIDRYVVNIQKASGSKGNMTYARYLMQEHLGRVLGSDEHVDHVNENRLDDRIENLQILDPPANTRKTQGDAEFIEFTCPECGGPGVQRAGTARWNRKAGKAGPFCSRRCAGRRNAKLRKYGSS